MTTQQSASAQHQVDLHSHSLASDGTLSPTALIALAASRGVRVLALTDHDTTAGVAEAHAAGRDAGVELIPGVEISCDLNGRDVHILGLFIDPSAAPLAALLDAARAEREVAADRMHRRLASLGVPVDPDEVAAHATGDSVGRPHFARALVARGHVSSMRQAFERFLGDGRPAHVWRDRPSIEAGIAAIKGSGGLALAAHPAAYSQPLSQETLHALRREGLDGIETLHPSHSPRHRRRYTKIAEAADMAISGGSDFHGTREGAPPGTVGLDDEQWVALAGRAGHPH